MAKEQQRWTDAMETKLSELLLSMVERGYKATNLKKEVYCDMAKKVNEACKPRISLTTQQVKTHIKDKKKLYLTIKAAINSSGFGVIQWNSEMRSLTAEDAAWEAYCSGKDKRLHSLKGKLFILYDAMQDIYGNEVNVGSKSRNHMEQVPNEVTDDDDDLHIDEQQSQNVSATMGDQGSQHSTQGTNAKESNKRTRERGSTSSLRAQIETLADIRQSQERIASFYDHKSEMFVGFKEAISELIDAGFPLRLKSDLMELMNGNPAAKLTFMQLAPEERMDYAKSKLEKAGVTVEFYFPEMDESDSE